MVADQVSAQQASTARTKGPPVWLDMDQKELDDAYDQSVYAPNQQLLAKRRRIASEAALKRLGQPERVAYGPTEIEKLDIYRTPRSNAPINIFIHGGAWRNGQAKDSAFLAEMFTNAGVHLVIPDFVQVKRGASRRRTKSHLHHGAFFRRSSQRLHARYRLAKGFRLAGEHSQRRALDQRYVRLEARQAVETQRIRQVHR